MPSNGVLGIVTEFIIKAENAHDDNLVEGAIDDALSKGARISQLEDGIVTRMGQGKDPKAPLVKKRLVFQILRNVKICLEYSRYCGSAKDFNSCATRFVISTIRENTLIIIRAPSSSKRPATLFFSRMLATMYI